jgi:hypothetical protein
MGIRLVFAMLLAVSTASCRHESAARIPAPPESASRGIASFAATPGKVAPGDPVSLSWVVRGSELIILEQAADPAPGPLAARLEEIGRYTESGSLEVHPQRSMVYLLSCEGATGGACSALSAHVTVRRRR